MSTGGPGYLGSTPAGPVLDLSPVKHPLGGERENGDEKDVMSSSPPPMDGPGASPSKRISTSTIRFNGGMIGRESGKEVITMNGRSSVMDPDHSMMGKAGDDIPDVGAEDDEYEEVDSDGGGEIGDGMGDVGFDLARGFQPIGSFTSSSSQPRQLAPLPQQHHHQQQEQRQQSHVRSGSAAVAAAAAAKAAS